MPNDQERPEDQLERMLAEHAAGIPSPQHGEFDRLVSAGERLRDAQRTAPPPLERNRAFSRMMNEAESERMRLKSGRFAGFWSSIVSRPVAGTALTAVVALVVVSAVGIGAATATGNGQPVRELLRISRSSSDLEFRGTIVSIGASEITVDSGGVLHVLTLTTATRIKEHGDSVDAASLVVGASVEVHAQTQSDGSVLALTIGIEDNASDSATPGTGPTPDNHGGDRPGEDRTPDDSSGPGTDDATLENSSDDATPDDSSGHGSDDATPENSAGHGSDDATPDNNSGSASNDATPDNSAGHGSDDATPDNNSGPASNDATPEGSSGHGSDDGSSGGTSSGPGGGN